MRWLFRLMGLIVVLAILVVAGLFFIPTDRIATLAANRFEQATGRHMTISGGVHATLWPQLGVRTGAVEIANAPWSKAGPMVKADGLSVGVDPMALLSGRVKVEQVVLDAPAIVLERSTSGAANWSLFGSADGTSANAGSKAAGEGSLPPISIAKATIKGGTMIFVDDKTGQKVTVDGLNASLSMPDAAGPAKIALSAAINGQSVKVDAGVDKAAEALAGRATPVTLKASAGKSTIAFDGSVDPAKGSAKGTLDAALDDLPALFKAAGQAAPALPQGLGAKRILAKGTLDAGTSGKITLGKASLTLDDNALHGQLALALGGPRPMLTGALTGDKLDLSALGGGATGAKASADGKTSRGWSKAPIDASAAGRIDADLSLSAAAMDLGKLQLGKTSLKLSLKAGKLLVDIGRMTAYQGAISGRVAADVNNGLAVAADLSADKVALQPLLGDLAGFKRLITDGTLKAKLSASGRSMDALMHSLSGSGSMALGKGELQGLDLVGMITHLDASYMGPGAKTIFDSITGTFAIKAGVLKNDDLAFASPLLKASGKGAVGIGDKTLDYTVTPTALQGVAGSKGLTVPVKISGSWNAPKYGLDMQSAAGQKLKEGAASAIDKALGGSQDKSGSGTDSGSGNSLKDLTKKGLDKLFGG